MAFAILQERSFQRDFAKLPKDVRRRLSKGIRVLEDDPRNPRSGADIRVLQGDRFEKMRLRVGDYRVVYFVDGTTVKLLEVWHRGRDRYDRS